ncbi:hypothetical protein N136_02759, partial [Leifsonia aquatica ATCC 14665]
MSFERAQQDDAEPVEGTVVPVERMIVQGDTGESMTDSSTDGADAPAKPRSAPRRTPAKTAAA